MTKEQLCEKIDAIFDCYEELTQFTKDVIYKQIEPYCYDDYVSEYRCLMSIENDCKNILEIMRQDIMDYEALSKLKHNINKRLNTIRNGEQ